jgi:transposase
MVSEKWHEVIGRLRREKDALATEKARLLSQQSKLEQENEELKRRLEKAQSEIQEAQARIEELERVAARQMAPFRRREELTVPPAEKKRPGRKAGHPGTRRPRPRQIHAEVNVPLDSCPGCGGPVCDRTPVTQYVEELPPLEPIVTRLTTWKGKCACCGEVRTNHPLQTSTAQGAANVLLGPRAAALAVLFNKHLGIPLRKTCAIFKQGFGLSLTAGGLAQLLHRVAKTLQPQYEALKAQVRQSPVNYMDETSWYVGEPRVLWVATAPEYTLYHIDTSHGGPVAQQLLGKDYAGVLVTDCHGASRCIKTSQHKCIAHHLRALSRFRDKDEGEDASYLDAWKRLWQDVLELRRVRDEIPQTSFVERRAKLEAQWSELLAREATQTGDRKFRARMQHMAEHRFGCLYHDVEATNNRAERAIRPAVIARKVSCGNKTERGAATWQILVSLAATAVQAGRDFVTELTTALPLACPAPVG